MASRKILLIAVAGSKFWRPMAAGSLSMPPMGLLGMAAVLRMHGYQVRIIDMFIGLSFAEFQRQVRDFDPDVVGVSCYTECYDSAILVSKKIRELLPTAPIVMGGPHVTFTVEQTFAECAVDYVVLHEGESTLLELMLHLEVPEAIPISGVRGLAYRQDDRVTVNALRPSIAGLSALPLADLSLVNLASYKAPFVIVTSRGCPGNCIYCSARAMWGSRYRARPAEHVFSEVVVRAKQTGRKLFTIPDDTFTADVGRVREFCRLLIESDLGLTWHCESRADAMTEDLLDLMSRAGCRGVQFGIETADQRILASLRKGVSLRRAEELVAHTRSLGMVPRCSFMLGHHTDTPETIRATTAMAIRFHDQYGASCAVSASTPYPGTYLYDHRAELGITLHARRWEEHIFSEPMVSGRGFSVDDVREALFEVMTFLAQKEYDEHQARERRPSSAEPQPGATPAPG
jgi:anaerobic magnesium-protoporphyrin IX monomethyl ester cyclase